MKMNRLVSAFVLVAMLIVGISAISAQEAQIGPITQRIIDRGELVCGVNNTLQGFGFVNDGGEYSGFDVDFCRAVAVAILGDATKVQFRYLAAADRQAAIQSGEIDVMIRNTTWTLSRDVTWGATFGPTTFYDGQGIGTRVDTGAASLGDLDGSSICVQSGTTTELNITDYINSNGWDIEILVFPDADSTWSAFLSGACQSWTTDKSGIAAYHLTAPDPSQLTILPETISKEPLGPLSPQSDPQFAEIVAWTVYGMISAEEFGITSQNVDEFLTSENPAIQRLLGQNNSSAGSYLGIANDFVVNVIRQVGNYGEVYDRNLVPLGLTREGSPNAPWTEGGLIYAPPFR